MPFRRFVAWFLLSALVIPIAGCVYLRLLEVKRQLADFEKYCSLENRDALVVIFHKPVLLKDDILLLARRGPTLAEDGPKKSLWQYHFVKQYLPHQEEEKGRYDVPVRLFFEENKMYGGTLPEAFYHLMPRAFLIEAIRAIGRSRVNPVKRHAKGEFYESRVKLETPLPKKQDFLRLLGRPYSEEDKEGTSTLTFVYRLQRGKLDRKPQTDAWARLTFLKGEENLTQIEAKFAGLGLSLSLRKGAM
ncbi:MAG: hypothetical protein AB1512_10810 [Thermodesulfobacteriota bacterium]